MKKTVWRLLCVLLIGAVALFVAGCGKTIKTDYEKIYTKYLDYSLGAGNWTAEREDVTEEYADFGYQYFWWTVEFTDSQGVQRSLGFDNKSGSTSGDAHFARYVLNSASVITKNRIKEEIGPRYSEDGAGSNLEFAVSNYPLHMTDNSQLDYYRSVISTKDGLRLFDFDSAWLIDQHRYYLEVTGSFTDEGLYSMAADSLHGEIWDFAGAAPDLLIGLSLVEAGTGAVLEKTEMAYMEGKAVAPKPREGGEARFWFQDALRERYYPKEPG